MAPHFNRENQLAWKCIRSADSGSSRPKKKASRSWPPTLPFDGEPGIRSRWSYTPTRYANTALPRREKVSARTRRQERRTSDDGSVASLVASFTAWVSLISSVRRGWAHRDWTGSGQRALELGRHPAQDHSHSACPSATACAPIVACDPATTATACSF